MRTTASLMSIAMAAASLLGALPASAQQDDADRDRRAGVRKQIQAVLQRPCEDGPAGAACEKNKAELRSHLKAMRQACQADESSDACQQKRTEVRKILQASRSR